MLKLTGIIRAVATVGGGVDKKTGEIRPTRPVLQVEGLDNRGLVQLYTLTVPDLIPYQGRVGKKYRFQSAPGQLAARLICLLKLNHELEKCTFPAGDEGTAWEGFFWAS